MKGRCCDPVIKQREESTNNKCYNQNRNEEPVNTQPPRLHSSEFTGLDHPTEHKKDSDKCGNGDDLHNPPGCLVENDFNSRYISDIIIKFFDVLIQQTHDNNQCDKKQKPDKKGFQVFAKQVSI